MKEYNVTLIDYGEGKGKLVVESKFGKVTFAVKADSHMWVELERPHGEWVTQWQDTCSQCKKEFDVPTGVNGKALWNYCPNCGAKMVSSNSEIEKSKSEIVPDYRDGWRLRGEEK